MTGTVRRFVRTTDKPAHQPKLVVEMGIEVKVEQKIDLLAYYSELSERDQQTYAKFLLSNEQGYEPWECPMAFLWPHDGEPDFGYGQGIPLVLDEGVVDPEHVDIDDWNSRVVMREGDVNHVWSEFDADDCQYLLDRIPWMKRLHEAVGEDDDPDEAELARIPGPLDTPMEGI
jgi:hypothetical protein